MSDETPLRIVDFGSSEDAQAGGQGKRTLSSLDKITLSLLVAALLLAPLGAGLFATPNLGAGGPQDVLSWVQAVGVSLLGILVAFGLGVAVCREWQRPVAIGPVGGLSGAAILLLIWSVVSLLVHAPLSHTGLDALAVLMAALAMGGLIARLGRDRKTLLALLLVLVTAGSLAGAIGVREYLEFWKQGEISHRVFGTFLGPNFLAGYLLLTLPLALACFVAARERLSRLLLGLGLFLQTACLLLTGSRAGVAMLFVVLLAWLFLLARARVLRPNARQVGIALALMFVAAFLASVPLLLRVAGGKPQLGGASISAANVSAAADSQEHSGKFRQYTWMGTMRMARANFLFGTGVGSYETAYPRYAQTGFTAHAHDSLLQWTAETGAPGVLCLLVVLASSTAFGAYVLFLNAPPKRANGRPNRSRIANRIANKFAEDEAAPSNDYDQEAGDVLVLSPPLPLVPSPPLPFGFADPRILLAGLLTAVISTTLHSLFDSDWYIVATALTLSATLGLLSALARDLAPLATQTPRPLSRPMLAMCGVAALVLLWRAGTTYESHVMTARGQAAVTEFQSEAAQGDGRAQVSLDNALDAYRTAAGFDPFDPEPLLALGGIYQSLGQPDKARQAFMNAVRVAPTGKTYYLLGQFHRRQAIMGAANSAADGASQDDTIALSGASALPANIDQAEIKAALGAFGQARDRDPHSLQTLRVLAETYALAGNVSEAMQTYRDIAALETTPLGTVRAMPERIETDFAYTHARLASALAKSDPAESLNEYQKADALLKSYWNSRHSSYYDLLTPEKRRGLNDLYAAVLSGWLEVLKTLGTPDPGSMAHSPNGEEVARVQAEQAAFEQDKAKDAEAERKAKAEEEAQSGRQGGSAP